MGASLFNIAAVESFPQLRVSPMSEMIKKLKLDAFGSGSGFCGEEQLVINNTKNKTANLARKLKLSVNALALIDA